MRRLSFFSFFSRLAINFYNERAYSVSAFFFPSAKFLNLLCDYANLYNYFRASAELVMSGAVGKRDVQREEKMRAHSSRSKRRHFFTLSLQISFRGKSKREEEIQRETNKSSH